MATQDITSRYLEAAILDQKVAGMFDGKRYAFVTVIGDDGWQLGVAVEDEPGYSPITGKTFADRAEAQEWASGLNQHIGLHPAVAQNIVISTMRGPARAGVRHGR